MYASYLSYQIVESMRNGLSPEDACHDAILRIMKKYNAFSGAVIAVDKFGNHGKYIIHFFNKYSFYSFFIFINIFKLHHVME